MRRYLLVVMLLALVSCGNNHKNTENDGGYSTDMVDNPNTANGVDTAAMNAKPTMDFKDTVHNFGKIHEGEKVEYDFEYMNNGKSPLVISGAEGSCGCTVADYKNEPIAPGKGGIMKVIFNSAGKSGHQEKNVTIYTNAKRGEHMLFITAEVDKK